jgi:hypothetical protein
MAKARGGAIGAIIASVILGVFFIFALITAIIFYTQASDTRQQLAIARADAAKIIKSDETLNSAVQALLNAGNDQSVVGGLLQENQALRQLASPDPQATVTSLRSILTSMDVSPDTSLLAEIRRLQAELKARDQELAQIKGNLEQQRQRAEAAEKRQSDLAGKFDQSLAAIKVETDKSQTQHNAYRNEAKGQVNTLEGTLTKVRTDLEGQLANARQESDQQRAEIDRLQRRIAELELIRGDVLVNKTAQPDGKVASLLQTDNLVYINRGQVQHVIPGMTFEVFAPNQAIKPDEYNDLRGKATLEVVNVQDNTATARIVRTAPGTSVVAGDLIVNLAYDPDQTFRFHSFGDFDLDNTGKPTPLDKKRIDSLVARYGGQLMSELTYQTDYLVLGNTPPLPDPLPSGVTDPETIAAHVAATQKYERYQQLVSEARSLKIPILNQNRFLALVGYYER